MQDVALQGSEGFILHAVCQAFLAQGEEDYP